MKLVYKRSSASTVLKEPDEVYLPEASWPAPSPAPAGALHRVHPSASTSPDRSPADDYIPQRGSYDMRLRGGIPRSLAGRILLGTVFVVLLGGMALLIAEVRQFLLHDHRFLISASSDISVEGSEHISRAEVLGVFGSDLERNLFKIPIAERRADLERLPWVAHAAIERLLPNHLRVRMTERTPIAFVRQGSHIGLVDADGVLLDMPTESAGDPQYSFPVLTGLAADDTPETRAARMDIYRRFMADLDSAGQRLTTALSEVDVSNPEDVKALVAQGGSDILVHFGDERFLERYRAFQRHMPDWRTQYPKLASADMRYERQVVLEMQGGGTPQLPENNLGIAPGRKPSEPLEAPSPNRMAHTPSAILKRSVAGRSAANERLFRELAAQKAVQAKIRAEGR